MLSNAAELGSILSVATKGGFIMLYIRKITLNNLIGTYNEEMFLIAHHL